MEYYEQYLKLQNKLLEVLDKKKKTPNEANEKAVKEARKELKSLKANSQSCKHILGYNKNSKLYCAVCEKTVKELKLTINSGDSTKDKSVTTRILNKAAKKSKDFDYIKAEVEKYNSKNKKKSQKNEKKSVSKKKTKKSAKKNDIGSKEEDKAIKKTSNSKIKSEITPEESLKEKNADNESDSNSISPKKSRRFQSRTRKLQRKKEIEMGIRHEEYVKCVKNKDDSKKIIEDFKKTFKGTDLQIGYSGIGRGDEDHFHIVFSYIDENKQKTQKPK